MRSTAVLQQLPQYFFPFHKYAEKRAHDRRFNAADENLTQHFAQFEAGAFI